MEDWDLLAVVRGHNNTMESHDQLSIINSNIDNNTNSMELLSNSFNNNAIFPNNHNNNNNLSFQDQDELFNTYSHLFETTTAFDELEELYKPFYPGPTTPATATATVFSSSSNSSLSSPSSSVALLSSHFDSRQALEHHNSSRPKVKIAKEPASKYKKRKNQQKRVVKEVREDGLSSDMWAWRKYGQKPIKGSPYPRSYYRCSSSKGCSARKQVERSPSNPDTFIITYTAEHSHPHPTRRNSLAGSTRTKFPGPGAGPAVLNDNNKTNKKDIDRDDSTTTTSSENVNVDVKSVVLRHDHSQLFASLDDLERGLEELIDRDEDTTSDDHDNINNDYDYDYDHKNMDYKSELSLDGGFFGDYDNNEANWFVDQYNTTITGAC